MKYDDFKPRGDKVPSFGSPEYMCLIGSHKQGYEECMHIEGVVYRKEGKDRVNSRPNDKWEDRRTDSQS